MSMDWLGVLKKRQEEEAKRVARVSAANALATNRVTGANASSNPNKEMQRELDLNYKSRAARGIEESKTLQNMVRSNDKGVFDATMQDKDALRQKAVNDMLLQKANGQSSSAAQMTMNAGMDDLIAQSAANQRSAMTGSDPSAVYNTIRAQQAQGFLAEQAKARAEEQFGASQAYVQSIGATREADQQKMAEKADLVQKYIQQGMQYEDAVISAETDIRASEAAKSEASKARRAGQTNAIIGGVSSLLGAGIGALFSSDKNAKKNIKNGDEKVTEFLDKISSKEFEYKNNPEKLLGILAQDLEKSKMGKNMVEETPAGKAVDTNKAVMALLASAASMNKRLKSLEKK